MIVLGVDAGASKIHAVLADENARILGVGRAGSANWEVVGLEGARQALEQAVSQALSRAKKKPEHVTASAYGLAGLDWPSDEGRLKPIVDSLKLSGPAVLVNDSFLPLRAGLRNGVGLAIIAGSGTTVAGRNASGQIARSFGSNYPFPDWGGAWDLAGAAIYAVASAYRRLGPQTLLSERMRAMTGCSSDIEMLEKIMREEVKVGGEFAPQIFECADLRDEAALAILRRAGDTMGANVLSVAEELGLLKDAFQVVTAGGVFSNPSPTLAGFLLQKIHTRAPGARLVHWEAPPVVGALLLAFDEAGASQTPEATLLAERVTEALHA